MEYFTIMFIFSLYSKAITGVALCCLLFIASVNAQSQTAEKQLILDAWSFYDGDFSEVNGKPVIDSEVNWQSVDVPILDASQHQSNTLWFKRDLPKGNWRDPYIFISSIDLTVQVFHNNTLIYQFGEFDQQGNSEFSGWPWHIIRLPDNYHEHPIYFRVYSDYHYAGLSGDVFIGNQYNLLTDTYERGFIGFLFILFVLIVGVISTIMGTIKKDNKVAMCTGLLSFNLALMMFAENELNQELWFNPLVWRYLSAFCYFLVPAFLALIMITWFRKNSPKVAYGVLITSLLFVVGVLGLSFFADYNFVNAYPYFDMLFIVLVLVLFAGCLNHLKQVGLEGIIMTIGVFALFVSLLLDMMSAHRIIDWLGRASQWGLILFTLTSLVIYLIQDWQQQIALSKFAHELEDKVEERTQALKASQEKLKQVASEDFLTSLLNRRAFAEQAKKALDNAKRHEQPVSLILFDIDHFKEVNDQYGHSTGDLVLKAIAYTCKNVCRNSELVCRYGGEEFAILLHSTEVGNAMVLANRLRESINAIEVTHHEKIITITASFGLVSMVKVSTREQNPEELLESLLAKADKLMYQVKVSGRDAIKATQLS